MKEKKLYLEILRIIAVFFVIYVHTGTEGAELYTVTSNTFSYWLSLFLGTIAQISVPVFFLISGSLLLPKEETLKDVLGKRALKILCIILIFGLFQYWYCFYLKPEIGFNIFVFFKLAYTTTVITQYWYLYSYLTLLLILPFLRMLAKSMMPIHFWYLFGSYFLMEGILPIAEHLWGNTRLVLSNPLFFSTIFYTLAGYYIEHKSNNLFLKGKNILVANIFAIAAIITNIVVARMAHLQRGAIETLGGMIFIIASVLFINIRYLYYKFTLSKVLKHFISFLGGGVFMVYLLEPQLRDSFRIIYLKLSPTVGWFPSCVLWICSAILAGCTIMYVVRKIPLLKKLF